MAGQATVRSQGQQTSAWMDGTGFLPCRSLKKMEANHSGPLSQALREILYNCIILCNSAKLDTVFLILQLRKLGTGSEVDCLK